MRQTCRQIQKVLLGALQKTPERKEHPTMDGKRKKIPTTETLPNFDMWESFPD
jgi:hypothetical protein